MIFGIDTAIIVSLISLIGTLIMGLLVRESNKKVNLANSKKTNAEADRVIYDLQNQAIGDLQKQVSELRKEVDIMKRQEHVYVQEKVRLEEKIINLKSENEKLKGALKSSNSEISNLTNQLKMLRKDITKIKSNA